MKNKKGISAIVATVLIILITVAAVTIIWAAIIPMISNELGGATECFDASASLSVISDYSCWTDEYCENTTTELPITTLTTESACTPADTEWHNLSVDIQIGRATGDFTLLGVDISGSYRGTSDTVKMNSSNLPSANGAKVYIISVGTGDDQFNLDGIDAASVSARVESGQTDKVCDGSAVIPIVECV